MRYRLTATERAIWDQRGWLVRRAVASAEEMARLSEEVAGLHHRMADPPAKVGVVWEPGDPSAIRQLMNSELVCPTIEALSHDARLLEPLVDLIGSDILLFHSKLMMKAAGSGSFTPWHQDYAYWRRHSTTPSAVNAMLAIDAQTEANGAIRFVDGSHRHGLLDHRDLGTESFAIGLPGDLAAYAGVPCILQPGDVVYFSALVVHGSGPNESTRHRRANTFAFDRPGNRQPELPPDRMRRGSYPVTLAAGPFADWR